MSIVLLCGSHSYASRSQHLLNVIQKELEEKGYSTHAISIRNLPAQALLHMDAEHPSLMDAKTHIATSEALIIATPVYKAAYSGLLKLFLDLLPQKGLAGKHVLPIAVGGSAKHMLMLDYALRPVLVSLAAQHILPGIYAIENQISTASGDQQTAIDPTLMERLQDGLNQLDQHLSQATQTLQHYSIPIIATQRSTPPLI